MRRSQGFGLFLGEGLFNGLSVELVLIGSVILGFGVMPPLEELQLVGQFRQCLAQ
jgi:hypothetical protein